MRRTTADNAMLGENGGSAASREVQAPHLEVFVASKLAKGTWLTFRSILRVRIIQRQAVGIRGATGMLRQAKRTLYPRSPLHLGMR